MPSGAIQISTFTMEDLVAIASGIRKGHGAVRFAILHRSAGLAEALWGEPA